MSDFSKHCLFSDINLDWTRSCKVHAEVHIQEAGIADTAYITACEHYSFKWVQWFHLKVSKGYYNDAFALIDTCSCWFHCSYLHTYKRRMYVGGSFGQSKVWIIYIEKLSVYDHRELYYRNFKCLHVAEQVSVSHEPGFYFFK